MSDIFPSAGQVDNLEHTDENHAKKVNSYVWDAGAGAWERATKDISPVADYDYLDVQQTSGTVETYVFKTGGSGGTTVRTIVVTYTSGTKTDIDYVTWS